MSRVHLKIIVDSFRHDRRILIRPGIPKFPSCSLVALVRWGFRGFSGRTRAHHPSPAYQFFWRFSRSRLLQTWCRNTRFYSRISEKATDLKSNRKSPAAFHQPAGIWAQLLRLREKSSKTCFYFEISQYSLYVWPHQINWWGEDNWFSGLNSGLYLHECCHHGFLEGLSVWQHWELRGLLWITQLSHQHPRRSHGFKLLEDKQKKDSQLFFFHRPRCI